VPIKVPVLPVDVPGLELTLDFRATVNDSVSGGSFSVVPLFGLFADFSQIDDVAHLARTAPFQGNALPAQTAHPTQSLSPHPTGTEYIWQSDGIFFLFARHGWLNTYYLLRESLYYGA